MRYQMFLLYSSIITSKDILAAVALLSLSMVYMKFCSTYGSREKPMHDWRRAESAGRRVQEWKVQRWRAEGRRALTTFTLLFLCLALMFLMSVTICVYRV